MRAIHKTIGSIAARAIETLKMIALLGSGIEGVVMARVIEFYVPTSFRKPVKWVPPVKRGKIIEFCHQTRKSA